MGWFEKKVTKADVVWCYETLLHRNPESELVIAEKLKCRSFRDLVAEFVRSPEFHVNVPGDELLSEEDVAWCYLKLLGRPPESPEAIREKLSLGTFRRVAMEIGSSDEFFGNREVYSELAALGFEVIHGRAPQLGEVAATPSTLRAVKALRKLLVSSGALTKSPRVESEADEPLKQTDESTCRDNEFRLLIVQTCDHERYVPMLLLTSKTVLAYVQRWHVNFEVFFGVKHGAHPWHATFNRIYKLDELLCAGYRGWVLYLDSDAYFRDLTFDLRAYLSDKGDFAFIASRVTEGPESDTPYWDVNAGVFFINLGHPAGQELVRRWKGFYDRLYTDDDYLGAVSWNMVINDQDSLHGLLKLPEFKPYVLSSGTKALFNCGRAKVIRQALRVNHASNDDDNFQNRLDRVKAEVDAVLANSCIPAQSHEKIEVAE